MIITKFCCLPCFASGNNETRSKTTAIQEIELAIFPLCRETQIPNDQILDNKWRELQNSLRGKDLAIFSLVRFFSKRHILLAIGSLQKIESNGKSANPTPNGVAIPSMA